MCVLNFYIVFTTRLFDVSMFYFVLLKNRFYNEIQIFTVKILCHIKFNFSYLVNFYKIIFSVNKLV